MATNSFCPACSHPSTAGFLRLEGLPLHCNVLLRTRELARQYPRGDVVLAFCQGCGLIYNLAFEPELMNYSTEYENSLTFSPFFQSYLQDLAHYLIDKHQLKGKDIIEIGCGKGDFLTMLCEMGGNQGVGFDPTYELRRDGSKAFSQIKVIRDFYSERYSSYQGDLVCSRHTLEHVQHPAELLATIRRSIRPQRHPVIFFEVPNAAYMLREVAVWDVIYEHCSYFGPESLVRLFTACGFEVIDLREAFDGQYIWVEALPSNGHSRVDLDVQCGFQEMATTVAHFARASSAKIERWRRLLQQIDRKNQKCVVWGAGSKGVTFLNLLNLQDQVDHVVDINPHKQGMFIPGTGQPIVAPEFLKECNPDVVLVMNPIYLDEIGGIVSSMGIDADLLTV